MPVCSRLTSGTRLRSSVAIARLRRRSTRWTFSDTSGVGKNPGRHGIRHRPCEKVIGLLNAGSQRGQRCPWTGEIRRGNQVEVVADRGHPAPAPATLPRGRRGRRRGKAASRFRERPFTAPCLCRPASPNGRRDTEKGADQRRLAANPGLVEHALQLRADRGER